MASGFIGNEVPRKGLRVRVPCPPLIFETPCFAVSEKRARRFVPICPGQTYSTPKFSEVEYNPIVEPQKFNTIANSKTFILISLSSQS